MKILGACKLLVLQIVAFYMRLPRVPRRFCIAFVTFLLILGNILFFYLFAISLYGVFLALLYFAFVVAFPGLLIALVFCKFFHVPSDQRPSWHLMIPLMTIFGIGNLLSAYLIAKLLHVHEANYMFALPYFLLPLGPVRAFFRSIMSFNFRKYNVLSNWQLPIFLIFIFAVNILLFSMRPTPGILPLDIFFDHLWNVGNTVSLVSHFPLQSLNIELKPYIPYHILVHIMGAHMAIITGLTPHLVGLQFIFVPLVPLLILSMTSLLRQFFNENNAYLFYGLAVLLFGDGFLSVHAVKVDSYINSPTNFLGIIFFLSAMTLLMQLHRIRNTGRFIIFFAVLLLTTVAKGSIGIALMLGTVLWMLFLIWRKRIMLGDVMYCTGALLGFSVSFLVFFILPVQGQPTITGLIHGISDTSFPVVPFAYVTKNYLASPFVGIIYSHLPPFLQQLSHIILTIAFLPIHILLYYSYRLLVFYHLITSSIDTKTYRFIFIGLASLLVAYLININTHGHAFFLTPAIYILDVLFVCYFQKEKLFSLITFFYSKRDVYAMIGLIFIIVLPFLSMSGWFRTEYSHNFLMYGRIGIWMNDKLSKTNYRQSRQSITPEIYDALTYIRKFTKKDVTVVSPSVNLDGRKHISFHTSAFAERAVFLEGYDFGSIVKYVGISEIDRRKAVLKHIRTNYTVPEGMQNSRYIFLVDTKTRNELQKKYPTTLLYDNDKWSVLQIGANNSKEVS